MDVEWKSPWGALISALRDAFAVLNKSIAVYAGLAIAALAIDAFLTPLHPFVWYTHQWTATDLAMVIASYFTMANAVRTLAPNYKMTALDVLVIFCLTVLLVLAIALGFVLLIVPGFIVMARFGPIAYVYLLGRGLELSPADGGVFERTIDATAERGWPTLGLYLMIGVLQWVVSKIDVSIGTPATGLNAILLLNLLYFAANLWISQVTGLAVLRWVAVEEPTLVSGPDEGVPVPAAP